MNGLTGTKTKRGGGKRPAKDRRFHPQSGHDDFEAKTIADGNETAQCRGAVAQLLEYRLEYGRPEDVLCVAVDGGCPPDASRILERLGIAVVEAQDSDVRPLNDAGAAVLEPAPLSHQFGLPTPAHAWWCPTTK